MFDFLFKSTHLGVIEVHCHSLFSEDCRQLPPWFTAPPGTEGATRREPLRVIGTQGMAATENTSRAEGGVQHGPSVGGRVLNRPCAGSPPLVAGPAVPEDRA
ncbi:hypothetical protein ACFRDV_00830 [Streptomyces fagopyri]|uniref:hypothetical protein n=1 Tax=Streptomyces fagopyri TaxID=2662397 RepID=UPI0036A247E8